MEAHFKQEVELTAQTINELKQEGCFVFTLLADSHLNPTLDTSVSKFDHTLENLAAVHQRADIDALFHLGDLVFTGVALPKEYWLPERTLAVETKVREAILACNPNSFFVAGNHDGAGAQPAEEAYWYEEMVRFHGDRVCSVPGKGYYFVDFPEYRVRAICLMDTLRQEDKNLAGYLPDQLNWLANEALDIPENYKVLLFAHVALHGGMQRLNLVNLEELKGLLTAFQNRTVYRGEVVQADFTNRKNGEISALFGGHHHVQWSGYPDGLPFRVVETPCNMFHMPHHSASWIPEGTLVGYVPADRERGTVTEDLWDTVVFDTKNNCLHMVRFGSGEDVTYPL